MTPEQNRIPDPTPAWKSPWFWAIIGIVLVVLGANAFMAFFAVRSNPGLVTPDYYERGKSFVQRTKPEFLQQHSLGVEWELEVPEKIFAGQPARLRLIPKERGGPPRMADSVVLYAFRPSDSAKDFSHPMVREEDQSYGGEVAFPLRGVWDIIIEREKGEERQSLARRITVEER